ncbi:hypothetical protein [Mucilaginibacter aquaedulcis]|jgi:tetratricopeptide (TPR) repeat protein|uniref:hypothetical protein n=1 Tax=Mucilaginibacter aquaedulcis TaxID=1187081 RepID=UPI0025B6277E|nr:hypothetical protein [Mucilaginibacter aquaedulcis]MDN3549086.1 hypothetical protein [Mucilaginibacter aquaedulcis]
MKKLFLSLFILLTMFQLSAHADKLDSLKQKLQITSDSLKGPVYIAIADQYLLKNDSISSRRLKFLNQLEALNYTMLGLHIYSNLEDSLGLRTCYNNLSKIYRLQRKYIQAKWFILQSNSISRIRKDVPNIIASLIELSAIKGDMEDYKMAQADLNEALKLAIKSKKPKNESDVQLGYAGLYRQMKEFTKASLAIKRHEEIDDSIHKAQVDSLARLAARDSIQMRKKDSIIVKKKVYISKSKKTSKPNSIKRIASL